jgi:hypothetical protein
MLVEKHVHIYADVMKGVCTIGAPKSSFRRAN